MVLNINDPFRERRFWLSRDSGHGYMLGLEQLTAHAEDEVRIGAERSLENGEDVWYALAGMVSRLGAYSINSYDLDKIVSSIAELDGALAEQVRVAATYPNGSG